MAKSRQARVLIGWNDEQEVNLGYGETLQSAIIRALEIADKDVPNVMIQNVTNKRTKLTEINSVPENAQFLVFVQGKDPKLVTFP